MFGVDARHQFITQNVRQYNLLHTTVLISLYILKLRLKQIIFNILLHYVIYNIYIILL